jgi:hypothetical protein
LKGNLTNGQLKGNLTNGQSRDTCNIGHKTPNKTNKATRNINNLKDE